MGEVKSRRGGKPPTSLDDSLVVFFDQGGRKPPTSRDDSLVVVLGEVEGGGRLKATNESKRLVGGCFGYCSRHCLSLGVSVVAFLHG